MQLAVPDVELGTRVQGEPENVPDTPVSEKLTVPPGVNGKPADELSLTVAVQVEASPTTTGVTQETATVAVRGFTVMLADVVLELSAWAVSVEEDE